MFGPIVAVLPTFPNEVAHRLCVQQKDPITGKWGEPREISLTELVALAAELSEKQRAEVANAFRVHEDARLISKADLVTDLEESARNAIHELQLALRRVDEHRKQFPPQPDGGVIDCEFKEVDEP
jgi:hypothetical protein